MTSEYGITAAAISLPRLRLERSAIAAAHSWANPNLKAMAKGQKSFCSSDEDAITLGVAAASLCLNDNTKNGISNLCFASTNLPFLDRQHATLIGEALNLPATMQTMDVTASQRAGTSALIQQIQLGQATKNETLLIASECNTPKAASMAEMTDGDGAAAITLGADPIATALASTSRSIDLVDQYRTTEQPEKYDFEARWVLEQGYLVAIPEATNELFSKASLNASDIDHCIIPISNGRTAQSIARACGVTKEALVDNLAANVGHCGCAHPLLMLTECLSQAQAGETILLIGFGQGVDAILFEVTNRIAEARPNSASNMAQITSNDYTRYLSSKNLIAMDWGKRAERDNRTAMSVYFRKRKSINGFVGGKCETCATVQFPLAKVCVNPSCGAVDSQTDYALRNAPAQVKSFTEDWLGHSTNPPLKYGNVLFDNGANVMMEFCDFEVGELAVGATVQPAFRIKDIDEVRGFKRYFWKAAPRSDS